MRLDQNIAPLQLLGGFGYTANYNGVKGPYIDIFSFGAGRTLALRGDPLIPGSPEAITALGVTVAVPEPASLAPMMSGPAAVALRLRRAKPASSR